MGVMSPTYESLDGPAVLFAHRGARAHAPENTIEAFTLGLRLGATGLESDVWLTADGVAVLDHDGVVGGLLRRKQIADVDRADLPAHMPSLAELYEACGNQLRAVARREGPGGRRGGPPGLDRGGWGRDGCGCATRTSTCSASGVSAQRRRSS